MSTNCLIIGESGTGKSCSLRNLPGEETFLINVINKPLPFPKWKTSFTPCTKEFPNGNLFVSDNATQIISLMNKISATRLEKKVIVIDDFQYIMANEFMRRHSNPGKGKDVFALYNDIGDNAWKIISASSNLREDLTVLILSHSEDTDMGRTKCKTIGKLLDDKITLEGMFSIVLQTLIHEKQYMFLTQNNGSNTVKSPMGMFDSELIENDAKLLIDKIKEY